MFISSLIVLGQLIALAVARLDKPILNKDLSYLHDGLVAHLPGKPAHYSTWNPGWIPQDCSNIIFTANLSNTDVDVYNVQYEDCSTPWIICRHKDSPNSLEQLLDTFSQVPVRARQFVRHVVALPDKKDTGSHAYNSNGNIALFNEAASHVAVLVHETGHSLDLLGAYSIDHLSTSQNWTDAMAKDSKVPDGYAQSNVREDVAQNTVVAAFDINVPGGFGKIQPKAGEIWNQYFLIEKEASIAGNLLNPGGKCGRRLTNSPPVPMVQPSHSSGPAHRRALMEAPDVTLPEEIEEIPSTEFDTQDTCKPHNDSAE